MKKETEELNVLKQLFNGLSESDRQDFLDFIKTPKKNRSKVASNLLKDFSDDPTACPHCGSTHFVKNGTKDGKQRFVCRDCGKTFAMNADNILFSTKKDIDVWQQYVSCMMRKMSLRQCAKECGIAVSTAFFWRHKILDLLQKMMAEVTLDGVVEADETFFRVSYKGNHRRSENFKMPRSPHKRGTPASKRGLSQEQICVPCGINLNGLSIARVSSLGKPNLRSLENVLSGRIAKDSVFVTDSHRPYQKLSAEMELNHIRIPRNRHSVGTFNIQMLNNYHGQLKRMVFGNFKGVSTKYLNNYLVHHNFANYAKETEEEKNVILLNFMRTTCFTSRTKEIMKRPAVPVLA